MESSGAFEISRRRKKAWNYLEETWPSEDEPCLEAVMDKYNHWESYDQDMTSLGFQAPTQLAHAANKVGIPRDALILDAGCGTGFLGEALRDLGYRNMDGLDGSRLLLNKAEEKGVFKRTIHLLFTDDSRFPMQTGHYDAVLTTSIGPGHFSIRAVKDMIRIVKPGGYFGYTLRSIYFTNDAFKELQPYLNRLVAEGRMELILDENYKSLYTNMTDPRLEGSMQIYKILK